MPNQDDIDLAALQQAADVLTDKLKLKRVQVPLDVTLKLSQADYEKMMECLLACWWGWENDGMRIHNLLQQQLPVETPLVKRARAVQQERIEKHGEQG